MKSFLNANRGHDGKKQLPLTSFNFFWMEDVVRSEEEELIRNRKAS